MSAVQQSGRFDLHAINIKAHGDERLTNAELDYVVSLVSSSETAKAITANGVLLLAGNAAHRRGSLDRLRIICREGRQHENLKTEAALAAILEFLPAEELNGNPDYKEFAYRMAKSSFVPCRVSAMRALRQFGRMGDRQALALLEQAVTDSDQFVKKGAETALKLIRESSASDGN
jgi:hypothetical protein